MVMMDYARTVRCETVLGVGGLKIERKGRGRVLIGWGAYLGEGKGGS
jgi:hypothetical protein